MTVQLEGKVWGETYPIITSPAIEVHKIYVVKGGYCSKHKHQSKINAFYVLNGTLQILRWKNDQDALVDETVIRTGQTCIVPAGEVHQFVGLETTSALEIYWSELLHHDIVRETVGGIHDQ